MVNFSRGSNDRREIIPFHLGQRFREFGFESMCDVLYLHELIIAWQIP